MGSDATLAAALAQARIAWPGVSVDESAFAAHVATLASDTAEQLEIPDLYLAFACAHGDPAALALLEQTLLPSLQGPLRKVGVQPSAIDETLQRVRVELLVPGSDGTARILGYAGRGSLRAWLRTVGVRIGIRLNGEGQKYESIEDHPPVLTADPELELMKEKYGEAFRRAFATALAELEPKQRLLLQQRFRYHLGVEVLGAQYGVHAATITRWVQAARDTLAARTRAVMSSDLGLERDELASILRLIHSQIEITLSSHPAGTTGAND